MTGQTIGAAVAKQDEGPQALIEQYRGDFAKMLPEHINTDQWIRWSQGLLRQPKNKHLAQVAHRNPGSFLSALLDCARLGLDAGDTYHLVPFGSEIVGMADYTGLIELIYRAGAVSTVKAEIVYSADHFRYELDTMDRPEHRPNWFGDRGDMVGAYAYAIMRDGSTSQVVIRSKAEIEQVKAVSKTSGKSDSPWNQWPDRMWKKTVIRELSKLVPTSAEYMREQLRAARDVADESSPPRIDITEHTVEADEPIEGEIVEDGGQQ